MAKPLEINGEQFPTKKAAINRIRSILHRYAIGATLEDADFAFMRDLLERHHTADQKIGVGVASMFVMLDKYGGRCFALRRLDGSETDFSFNSCLHPKKPDADFRAACRSAVVEQIMDFRDSQFTSGAWIPCAISGEPVTRDTCHVDHVPPSTFADVLATFVASRGLDPTTVAIAGGGDGSMSKTLNDAKLLADWQAFHREHARLRITSPRANLSDSKVAANRMRRT